MGWGCCCAMTTTPGCSPSWAGGRTEPPRTRPDASCRPGVDHTHVRRLDARPNDAAHADSLRRGMTPGGRGGTSAVRRRGGFDTRRCFAAVHKARRRQWGGVPLRARRPEAELARRSPTVARAGHLRTALSLRQAPRAPSAGGRRTARGPRPRPALSRGGSPARSTSSRSARGYGSRSLQLRHHRPPQGASPPPRQP